MRRRFVEGGVGEAGRARPLPFETLALSSSSDESGTGVSGERGGESVVPFVAFAVEMLSAGCSEDEGVAPVESVITREPFDPLCVWAFDANAAV